MSTHTHNGAGSRHRAARRAPRVTLAQFLAIASGAAILVSPFIH